MPTSRNAKNILQSGGFVLHHYVGKPFGLRFHGQCFAIAAVASVLLITASMIDRSLILDGRNIGLLEHPGIWVFLILQISLPISIARAQKNLIKARRQIHEIAKGEGRFRNVIMAPFLAFVGLQTRESKVAATILYGVGLTAFVWNTYQNQLPGIVVPYDFWDSNTFFWGFWIGRAYKLYLFVWLLPYVALIYVGIITTVLRFIRRARTAGNMNLIPFHSDGVGGLGFVPALITTPIVITLLVGAISSAATFFIHRTLDVTPVLGLIIIVSWAGAAYIVPIVFLRSDIKALKIKVVERLGILEQKYYLTILNSSDLQADELKEGNEALDYFEKVKSQIELIPNYPHLKRLLKYIGIAVTPSVVSLLLKSYQDLSILITKSPPNP